MSRVLKPPPYEDLNGSADELACGSVAAYPETGMLIPASERNIFGAVCSFLATASASRGAGGLASGKAGADSDLASEALASNNKDEGGWCFSKSGLHGLKPKGSPLFLLVLALEFCPTSGSSFCSSASISNGGLEALDDGLELLWRWLGLPTTSSCGDDSSNLTSCERLELLW